MEYAGILVLVISFFTLLALGVPIAYSIGTATILTIMVEMPFDRSTSLVAQRISTGINSFTLLAIPFFILAGQIMNSGGIASRLIDFAKVVVGPLPGGLAFVNILSCMLFGAISGSAVAAASAIGGVMGKRMEAEGYSKSFSVAVNVTSSTTGMLIPPSNILIVYSLASGGTSIAALFLAGYIPGILIGALLMAVAAIWAYKNDYPVGGVSSLREGLLTFLRAIPSLLLLIIVIGGIIAGYFTATEASAIAVFYTFILSVVIYREVKIRDLPGILLGTVVTTSIVMLLIGASMGMSWAMSFLAIPQNVSDLLLSLSENKFVILLIINIILLMVGVFMDMTPAVLIFTPIFLPIVETQLGIDPIHFGILMVANLCIGLCTPPVGSVLFVGCGVANTTIDKVIKPLLPMFAVMVLGLLAITYIPQLSLWLPGLFGF